MRNTTFFTPYSANGNVISDGSRAILFVNEGNIVARINSLITLLPGDSFGVNQDSGDEDYSSYKIAFDEAHASSATVDKNPLIVFVNTVKTK